LRFVVDAEPKKRKVAGGQKRSQAFFQKVAQFIRKKSGQVEAVSARGFHFPETSADLGRASALDDVEGIGKEKGSFFSAIAPQRFKQNKVFRKIGHRAALFGMG